MTPELKRQWIAALRSGDYKQGKSNLKKMTYLHSEDIRETLVHCCLGVLCEVAGIPSYQNGEHPFTFEGNENDTSILLPDLQHKLGLPSTIASEAWKRNDGHVDSNDNYKPETFDQIANWLEGKDF